MTVRFLVSVYGGDTPFDSSMARRKARGGSESPAGGPVLDNYRPFTKFSGAFSVTENEGE